MMRIMTPVDDGVISRLDVGDSFEIFGRIFTGRDAVLPVLKGKIESGEQDDLTLKLRGSIVMHSGFSVAGFGPTTSGKESIEGSIDALAKAGVKIHLGKGALSEETIESLKRFNSIFALTPPITALLMEKVKSVRVIAFEHEGMEALHEVEVEGLPAIVAIAHGRSIYRQVTG
jgi:fumarate hydratase subunit beta